jgi:hypothetical protein
MRPDFIHHPPGIPNFSARGGRGEKRGGQQQPPHPLLVPIALGKELELVPLCLPSAELSVCTLSIDTEVRR